jgi:ABC-2 type transport system permease protein
VHASQIAALPGVLALGSLPFCALGLFIGAYASGNAAPAYANLAYLPMIWLSGMFIPVPPALRWQVPFWPAFHVDQLALKAVGLDQFVHFPALTSVGVLVGVTVLFSALAIHRLSQKG